MGLGGARNAAGAVEIKDDSTFLGSRRGKICLCAIVSSLVIIAILAGILYPRQPIVTVDRTLTANTLQVHNTSAGVEVTATMGMKFQNTNYYEIAFKEFDFSAVIGSPTNNITVLSSFGELHFPAQSTVNITIPVNQTIPPSVDINELGAYLLNQCFVNGNYLYTLVEGQADLLFLSSVVP